MSGDLIVSGILVVAFAAWVTTHVVLVASLLRRPPRWRALVGLLIAPAAIYFGFVERLRVRALLSVVCAVVYGVAWVRAYA